MEKDAGVTDALLELDADVVAPGVVPLLHVDAEAAPGVVPAASSDEKLLNVIICDAVGVQLVDMMDVCEACFDGPSKMNDVAWSGSTFLSVLSKSLRLFRLSRGKCSSPVLHEAAT